LASLTLEGAALVWWEAKSQEKMRIHGNISITWVEFVYAIKRHFYPLAYMQKSIMSWQKFRQLKGQTVQDYTQELRKRALLLGVNLNSQDTFLKYIGGLHSYLKHNILMFNTKNLGELCMQPRTLNLEERTFMKRVVRGSHSRERRKRRVENRRAIKMQV